MSDRYEQPTEGGHTDEWGGILNDNFFAIGADVDALEGQVNRIESSDVVALFGPELGASDSIDPTTTTTPVQDALDVINSTGEQGAVMLPSEPITESATITGLNGNWIIGRGNHAQSTIQFEGLGAGDPGVSVSDGTGFFDRFGGLANVRLRGGGRDTNSGSGLYIDTYRGLNLDNVWIERFGGAGIETSTASGNYEQHWQRVGIWRCGSWGVDIQGGGPGNRIDHLFIGGTYGVMNFQGGSWSIGTINAGPFYPDSATNCGFIMDSGSGRGVDIDRVNFEPAGDFQANGGTWAFEKRGDGRLWITSFRLFDTVVDGIFHSVNGAAHAWVGFMYDYNSTVNTDRVVVEDEPSGRIFVVDGSFNITTNYTGDFTIPLFDLDGVIGM